MTKEKTQENTEYQAGATLVDDGIIFKIPFLRGKLKLTVKPLKAGTIVKISQQVTLLQQVDESDNMIEEMLKKGDNLNIISKIIALGVLNSRIKILLFGNILTGIIKWNVESLPNLFSYLLLVYRQMGAQHFFFIMELTQGMNFLKKRTPTENSAADKHSGEQSQ